jgi:hypothetical protein
LVHVTNADVPMKSTAKSVVAYIEEQPPEWPPTLRKLGAACGRQLRGYTGRMVYGMPSHERRGQVEVSFGKQVVAAEAEAVFEQCREGAPGREHARVGLMVYRSHGIRTDSRLYRSLPG